MSYKCYINKQELHFLLSGIFINDIFLTMKSDGDDRNCNMQKQWNSFCIEISRGRIVARSGLFKDNNFKRTTLFIFSEQVIQKVDTRLQFGDRCIKFMRHVMIFHGCFRFEFVFFHRRNPRESNPPG